VEGTGMIDHDSAKEFGCTANSMPGPSKYA
jgi:hypothetical protein